MSNETSQSDEAFFLEIKEVFYLEATTFLQRFEDSVLALEKGESSKLLVEELFRAAHTIKGSAASVQFADLASYVHHLEEVLSQLKKEEISTSPGLIEILLAALDQIRTYLDCARKNLPCELPTEELKLKISQLGTAAPGKEFRASESLHAGLLGSKVKESAQIEVAGSSSGSNVANDYISISLLKIETILNHFGEQVILQSVLEHVEADLIAQEQLARRTIRQLSKLTLMLQDSVLSLRMVPVRPLVQKTSRTLRDIAKLLSKEIDFESSGEEVELDKTLAESLAAPLTHIIRNAADHGIELPNDRLAKGKSRRGKIEMRAFYNGGFFNLEIRDNGKGLDKQRLLEKATDVGIVAPDAKLSDEQIYDLIFHAGFSTKDAATEISGRGFGMDIVRKEIASLRGTIQIKTKLGEFTSFLIQLPMSVAIFNGMIVNVGKTLCIIPNSEIGEIVRLSDLKRVSIQGGYEMVEISNRAMPMVPVAKVTGFQELGEISADSVVIVIRYNDKPYALLVDEVVGQQRVVMKKLGIELQDAPGLSGGAILADGNVALVLKVGEVIDKFELRAA